MKNLIITTVLFLTTFLVFGQSEVINKDIDIIENFHTVNVNSRYTVYIKQSNETKIEVRALKEVMDISEFKVEDGVLNIDINREEKNRSIWEQIDDIKIAPKLDVYISMQDVKALNVNGNGKIITQNSISADELKLSLSGSGSLEADLKGQNLIVSNSGGGLMSLTGYANHAEISLTGYGKIEAYKLDLKTSNSKLTGTGNIELNVADELKAYAYGSGNIRFKGDTKKVTKKEHGSGKIERTY